MLQGWDFMLRDIANRTRKPLRGRRRGGEKKSELNRVKEKNEKQGFLSSWAKAARSKAATLDKD